MQSLHGTLRKTCFNAEKHISLLKLSSVASLYTTIVTPVSSRPPSCSHWSAHTCLIQHCPLFLWSALSGFNLPVGLTSTMNIGINHVCDIVWCHKFTEHKMGPLARCLKHFRSSAFVGEMSSHCRRLWVLDLSRHAMCKTMEERETKTIKALKISLKVGNLLYFREFDEKIDATLMSIW